MEDSHEVVRVLTSRVPGVDKERVDPRNGTERCVVCDRARLRCGKALTLHVPPQPKTEQTRAGCAAARTVFNCGRHHGRVMEIPLGQPSVSPTPGLHACAAQDADTGKQLDGGHRSCWSQNWSRGLWTTHRVPERDIDAVLIADLPQQT